MLKIVLCLCQCVFGDSLAPEPFGKDILAEHNLPLQLDGNFLVVLVGLPPQTLPLFSSYLKAPLSPPTISSYLQTPNLLLCRKSSQDTQGE